MDKAYTRINWEDEPSISTPLAARLLNRVDYATNEIDNRVIALDTNKASQSDFLQSVHSVTFDTTTGVLTVTYENGTVYTVDTKIEKLAVNFEYDDDPTSAHYQQLVITLDDGTKQYVDMSSLITQYEFDDSTDISFTVGNDGRVSATIKNGSVTRSKLDPDYLAQIDIDVAAAAGSARDAAASASEAGDKALVSEGWAKGTQNGVPVDPSSPYYHNNAEYYKDQTAGQTISGLRDTNIDASTLADGEPLIYDATNQEWINADGRGIVTCKDNVASGNYSFAEGSQTCATSNYGHAEGRNTRSTNNASHAEGSATTASGIVSHAEGQSTRASGNGSHTEGYVTCASGQYSHAEGSGACASGNGSHAEGYGTCASGQYAHAEGNSSYASHLGTHAEGNGTSATAPSDHAEGQNTCASGGASHAEGLWTLASNPTSHSGGRYNEPLKFYKNNNFVNGSTSTQFLCEALNDSYDSTQQVLKNKFLNRSIGRGAGESYRDNYMATDFLGNLFMAGAPFLRRGVIEGQLIATSKHNYALEPGAMYILFCCANLISTGAWRGMNTYIIGCNHGIGTSSSAQRGIYASIGAGGTTGVTISLNDRTTSYTHTDGVGTTSTRYKYGLGIGSCTTDCRVRYSLIKVLGSYDDFALNYTADFYSKVPEQEGKFMVEVYDGTGSTSQDHNLDWFEGKTPLRTFYYDYANIKKAKPWTVTPASNYAVKITQWVKVKENIGIPFVTVKSNVTNYHLYILRVAQGIMESDLEIFEGDTANFKSKLMGQDAWNKITITYYTSTTGYCALNKDLFRYPNLEVDSKIAEVYSIKP